MVWVPEIVAGTNDKILGLFLALLELRRDKSGSVVVSVVILKICCKQAID